ncbi:hypothetical protein ABZW18_02650 [Streptomyces sp. NPDC004647]|uniref:hypothetical protein n=1 Tax=Streptomyces sp. NPDC004647 TaxID=3154671 RepID=UPI0033B8E0BB
MGWTVLYIAFGIVALWLLGEVLLQYKARLRWRLLAFAGFLGVVLGVLLPSVPVIGVGAITFAIGQTYVTLSFRRGFSTGWAIGGSPGSSRRRKDEMPPLESDPTLEVSDLEAMPPMQEQDGYGLDGPESGTGQEVYQPQPLPDDTEQYGVYSDSGYNNSGYSDSGYSDSGYGTDPQSPYATYGEYSQDGLVGQGGYANQYDYGNGQYAAYSDPYIGAAGAQQYDQYASYGGQQYDYGTGQYAADPYGAPADQQYSQTPPGGVWVPQQRDGEQPPVPPMPDEQPYPYQQDYNNGYGEQYRY